MTFDEHIRQIKPRNTRQQDLFLFAKGHYDPAGNRSDLEDVRRLLALHQNVYMQHMRWRDTAYLVLSDLEPLMTPELKGRHFVDFMMGFGPNSIPVLGPDYTQPGEAFAVIIEKSLSVVRQMQVREGGRWLLSLAEPQIDPAMLEALDVARAEAIPKVA